MKKYLKILVMLCLILVVPVGAVYLQNTVVKETFEASASADGEQKENPAPYNPDDLRRLGLEPFSSELPVLMVDTKEQEILKDSTIWVEVAVLDDVSGANDITAAPQEVLDATIKYRGASSYSGFDKPQYRLEFYKKAGGKELEYDLFGLGADSEWVINGPYLDRSLLRNYLMYHLAEEIMDWAPASTFCELFVDGRYQGVYLAVEPVTDGASRLRLSRFGLVSGATPYIVKRDRVGTEENVLHTYGELAGYTGNELSVSYPGKSKLTQRQLQWIEQDISEFERALYSDYFADPQVGYAKYINVDSFVDYFILNEFSMNHDAGGLSTYAYKELGGKLQLAVWDFNNGFDNYRWFEVETDEFLTNSNYWFDRLIEDRGFVQRVEERYRQLRQTNLSDENIQRILERGQQELGDAVERNFALWGYTFKNDLLAIVDDSGVSRDPNNYQQALEMLEETIEERLAFLDTSISELYEGCVN